MKEINLSKRLKAVASHIPTGAYFADIGADHAYLACYACMKDKQAKAIASDVNKGPYLSAKQTVNRFGLGDRINVCLGDGLSTVKGHEITTLIIAGMGGSLMKDILDSGFDFISSVNRLILQPNIGEEIIRHWIINNNFVITCEEIIKENNNIYEIIVADRKPNIGKVYNEKELFFGPYLMKDNSLIFREKWMLKEEKINKIIKQMKSSKNINKRNLTKFKEQLTWIKEVLGNE